MADFDKCLSYALKEMKIDFNLKQEQEEALRNIFNLVDTICILPTGFGKSIIYQLLPCMMQKKHGVHDPMIVFVVAPLNSIMEDQIQSLSSNAIKACYISYDGTSASSFEDCMSGSESSGDDDDTKERGSILLPKEVGMGDLEHGCYHLIYAHPEALKTRKMLQLMRSKVYKERLCSVVIDEVHMISEWGEEFRPAFKHLGDMTCLFPNAGHLALTATCTKSKVKELISILQYQNTSIIAVNPDRPNIFIEKRQRMPNVHKYEKLEQMIEPLAKELNEKLCQFPVTIMYMENLEAVGYCYHFLNNYLQGKQYDGEEKPENRIFAQYHKDYTANMKSHIVQELTKQNPKLRLVLATVALGMGLNAPSITRIIHCRPPTSLEAYMQEIGRAGRKLQAAEAILYFNNSDIAKSRKGMKDEMIQFCRNDKSCLRLELVNHFGFENVLYSGDKSRCCSNCKKSFAE